MSTPLYYLHPHVFLCPVTHHWIVLDAKSDRYLCIHKRDLNALGPWVAGWHDKPSSVLPAPDQIPDNAARLAIELIDQGILTQDSSKSKHYRSVGIGTPSTSFVRNPVQVGLRFALRYLPVFLLAAGTADYSLRRRSFSETARRVEKRKILHMTDASRFAVQRASRLVAVFNLLRPIYPRDYLCLFDSLALLHFLASYGLYPTWVFGVAADPFQAHCWVQHSDVVINDTTEFVSMYTAIMTI